MEFLDVPDSYYDMLRNRLKASGTKIVEDLDMLQVYIVKSELIPLHRLE